MRFFYNIHVSRGSVATRLKCGKLFYYHLVSHLLNQSIMFICPKSIGERFLKTGQQTTKLEPKRERNPFFRTRCIHVKPDSATSRSPTGCDTGGVSGCCREQNDLRHPCMVWLHQCSRSRTTRLVLTAFRQTRIP